MSRFESITNPLRWFMALLLVTFVAGCGGNGGNTAPSSAKTITAFSLSGATGTIDQTLKTISVTLPFGTNPASLIATFTGNGNTVTVGTPAVAQVSGTTPNDFTNPVAYKVTAADGSVATYTVIVTVAPIAGNAITAFSLGGYAGTITGTVSPYAIAVTVPVGSNVTSQIATFATTGSSVTVGTPAVTQVSATTLNDFTAPVTYTVTAADHTTADYVVTVTMASAASKAITAFSFGGGTIGTITGTASPYAIAVTVPYGTNVTTLIPTFTSNGASVKIGSVTQVSGTTLNDFTAPVTYTVTDANGTTANYVVTVTVAQSSTKTITAFSLGGYAGTITGTVSPYAIAVTVPAGSNLASMIATFTTTGNNVKVGTPAVTQVSGTTLNDFTAPVTYTVTAADATTADYVVTVTVAPAAAKAITVFSLGGYAGTITGSVSPYAIAVTVPTGSNVTSMIATFTTTGSSVKVGTPAVTQVSGTTLNNFTSPVAYTVFAADASTAIYNVTVSASLPLNPTAPVLGETGRFVILASQAVTTTVGSVITNGDMGIMDTARSNYAGFTAGAGAGQFTQLINGLSYAHDDIAPALIPSPYASTIAFINQVRTDLGVADTFLAADPNPGAPTQVCPTELGNQVLTRGVYKTASNVTITTGPLTLDAQGDQNSVWIFNIGGTLTTGSPGGSIILLNGAQARNVYWRTAGTTIIGTNTAFYGNAFAFTQVNALTGASVTGRLFGETAQVTLDANAVTKAP